MPRLLVGAPALDVPDDSSARAHWMNVTGQVLTNDRIVSRPLPRSSYVSLRHRKVVRFPTMAVK